MDFFLKFQVSSIVELPNSNPEIMGSNPGRSSLKRNNMNTQANFFNLGSVCAKLIYEEVDAKCGSRMEVPIPNLMETVADSVHKTRGFYQKI